MSDAESRKPAASCFSPGRSDVGSSSCGVACNQPDRGGQPHGRGRPQLRAEEVLRDVLVTSHGDPSTWTGCRARPLNRILARRVASTRVLRAEPVVDPERVHADLRGVPAARGPACRPARAPPAVHGRNRAVLGRVAGLRRHQSSGELLVARGLQGLGGALVSPAALSIILTTFAEGRERNRAVGVGCDRRRRGCRRPAPWWCSGAGAQLALGVFRQRADRRRSSGAGAPDPSGEPVGVDGEDRLRHRGRGGDHPGQGRKLGLDLRSHDRRLRGRGRADRRLRAW
jgi:hypothetical protein